MRLRQSVAGGAPAARRAARQRQVARAASLVGELIGECVDLLQQPNDIRHIPPFDHAAVDEAKDPDPFDAYPPARSGNTHELAAMCRGPSEAPHPPLPFDDLVLDGQAQVRKATRD